MILLYLALHLLGPYLQAQNLQCLGCIEGVELCVTNTTNGKYEYVRRKCEKYECTHCISVGWSKKRFAYKIYNESAQYEFHGFSVFYQDQTSCEADRKVDIRCH